MKGKVSVIIPFYSGKEWLVEALDSVLHQTYKNYEIIVINDGSGIDLLQTLSKYTGIRYFEKENQGPGPARNLGIENARGEYIAFLDSDDIWIPEKLERQIVLMEQTGLNWAHSSYSTFIDNQVNKASSIIDLSFYKGIIFPKCVLSNPIATPTVIIRRELLTMNKELRFSSEWRYGEDSYLWMRIGINNPIAVSPESLAFIRIRGQNAALNVRIQLDVKAKFYDIFEKNKELYYGETKVNKSIKYVYQVCYFLNKIVLFCEKKGCSKRAIENLSRVLYFVPYKFLKTYYRFYFRNKY